MNRLIEALNWIMKVLETRGELYMQETEYLKEQLELAEREKLLSEIYQVTCIVLLIIILTII